MEVDRRPFQSVNIGMTSLETGRKRFTKHELFRPPPIAGWRCNLTALSQRYNLYFMASREGVAVFEPEFPFQKLKTVPKLYIPPMLANENAEGYLDHVSWQNRGQNPHDINHLVVGDLGSEEILLVSTDSGNVAAYHTKSIYDAIQRDPYRFSNNARSDYVGVRSFFSQWVHESAWGLAIHKEARMIAVSANTPYFTPSNDETAKITVFAFALTPRQGHDEDASGHDLSGTEAPHTEWHEWEPSLSAEATPCRDRNYRVVLAGEHGHTSNIPSISFVNTKEDPHGSWLLSCDIYGDTKCWQIWRGVCYGTWDFAEQSDPRHWRGQRRNDGGWMVAALDPSSFRPTSSMAVFCGLKKAPQYYGHMGAGDSYDISNIVRLRTPGRSHFHPLHPDDSEEDENERPEPDEVVDTWSGDESDAIFVGGDPRLLVSRLQRSTSFNQNNLNLPQRPARRNSPTLSQPEATDPRPDSENLAPSLSPALLPYQEPHRDYEAVLLDHPDQATIEAEGWSEDDSFDEEDPSASEDQDFSSSPSDLGSIVTHQTQRTSVEVEVGPPMIISSPEISSEASVSRRTLKPPTTPTKRPRHSLAASHKPKPIPIPFIPTLHLSQSHLRLINLPQSRSPHFFCANILKQELSEQLNHPFHQSLLRLNMLQQIPELGIFIIASQLGRCAVCSLTKYLPTGALGLRVDWTLPTHRQEKAGMRPPGNELLGIAVAPIQGREFSRPDPDADLDWTKDRNVDGVDTTFDPNVLVLSRPRRREDDSSSDDDSPWHSQNGRAPKRKRRSFSSVKSSSTSAASTEQRPWAKPTGDESWAAIEGTKRYRLMMTYSDMSVLTYEIGRGVEREDVAVTGENDEES